MIAFEKIKVVTTGAHHLIESISAEQVTDTTLRFVFVLANKAVGFYRSQGTTFVAEQQVYNETLQVWEQTETVRVHLTSTDLELGEYEYPALGELIVFANHDKNVVELLLEEVRAHHNLTTFIPTRY